MVRQVAAQSKAEMSAAFGPEATALLGSDFLFQGFGVIRNMPSFKKVGESQRGRLLAVDTFKKYSEIFYAQLKQVDIEVFRYINDIIDRIFVYWDSKENF